VDRAAFDVIFFQAVTEQWPYIRLSDNSGRLIPVECSLKRPQQDSAFGPVIEDDPQAAIAPVVACSEFLANICHVGDLPIDDVEHAFLDSFHSLSLALEAPRGTHLVLEITPH